MDEAVFPVAMDAVIAFLLEIEEAAGARLFVFPAVTPGFGALRFFLGLRPFKGVDFLSRAGGKFIVLRLRRLVASLFDNGEAFRIGCEFVAFGPRRGFDFEKDVFRLPKPLA